MASTRDPGRTRRSILDAAVAEFCAHGPAGARTDAIAAAAGVNKRMLYHYFGSKEGLLAAVLDDRLGASRLGTQRATAAATLLERHLRATSAPDETRLLMWEALGYRVETDGRVDDHAIAAREARAMAWRECVAAVEADQLAGRLTADVDAAQLELTFVAIALFPFAFPQLTRLITGQSTADAAFIGARSAFLERIAGLFATPSTTPSADERKPKARYRLTATLTESPQRSGGE